MISVQSVATDNINLSEEQVGSKFDNHYNMTKLFFGDQAKESESSSDDMSSDDSSSITIFSNDDLMADISQEPPKVGGVIVKTCVFLGVICMTFFELMSVAYLSLLKYGMGMGEESLVTRMRKHENSEVVWLGDDWSFNRIEENEN